MGFSQAFLDWEEATEAKKQPKQRALRSASNRPDRNALRQLARRIRIFPVDIRSQVEHLSITRLDELGEALLDFGQLTDLTTWLDEHR